MQPATVDPLNGYALLSVSISGFLPVVFTLMLLHSHGVRSWFTTILVFISWLLSTIVFFIIFKNLSNSESNQAVFDEGLDQLFSTPSCGGQSAMSLCQQLRGTNPLAYLTGFFNQSSIPNIKTVPLLWGWTTLILLTLVARQAFGLGPQPSDDEKDHHDASKPKPTYHPSLLAKTSFVLATIIFSLCLGYQFVMINTYRLMDVIDFDGWSFGQIVAVLFWVPPALEVMHSLSGMSPLYIRGLLPATDILLLRALTRAKKKDKRPRAQRPATPTRPKVSPRLPVVRTRHWLLRRRMRHITQTKYTMTSSITNIPETDR